MAGKYAAQTDVPTYRSRDEIERTLARFGASAFGYASTSDGVVMITFEINNLRVAMKMLLPQREEYMYDSRGNERKETAIERDWQQACRQRWRSLANGIKAKLALVDDEITTVESEFLAHIVIPRTGQTYGEFALPEIARVYEDNKTPLTVTAMLEDGQ